MQSDLDAYLVTYNTKRPHQGRGMNGRTPADVFARCLPKTKGGQSGKSRLEYHRPGAAGVRRIPYLYIPCSRFHSFSFLTSA